jgi:DNA repair protein SbcC/Rad50
MIITGLCARNVLKYATLDLRDIPRRGLIGIRGPNESGKSSIGETICFALFGRTFSLDPRQISKIIRWGEDQCSVRLQFSVNGDDYEISRMLDDAGNHSARLLRVGQPEPLARGVPGVADALRRLLGYGYEVFIESFYLAQREITTPHRHSEAIKVMAGIAPLEQIKVEIGEEMALAGDELQIVEQDQERIDRDLNELGARPGHLERLKTEIASRQVANDILTERSADMEATVAGYRDLQSRFAAQQRRRLTTNTLRHLTLWLALASGGLWWYLTAIPNAELATSLVAWLHQQVPSWESRLPWLLGAAAAVSGILCLVFWLSYAAARQRIGGLFQEAGALAERLHNLCEDVPVMASGDAFRAAPASIVAPGPGVAERPTPEEAAALRVGMAEVAVAADEVHGLVEHELAWIREQTGEYLAAIHRLQRDLATEEERLRQVAALRKEAAVCEERMQQRRAQLRLRQIADELLGAAIHQVSQRFNRDLRDTVGRILPLFTESRYEHLQIHEDLSVRVYSLDKRAFMDFDEISSGTQRQIMLAVRLALARELAEQAGKGDQFMILDEPFAFFDHPRTRDALAMLPGFSERATQLWVIGQDFPADAAFDMQIQCSRAQNAQTREENQPVAAPIPA